MSAALLTALLGAALLDSINPSALVMVTVLLATSPSRRAPLVYVAGIFVTYLSLGAAVLLGLGPALGEALDRLSAPSREVYVLEALVATTLLVLVARRLRRPRAVRPARPVSAPAGSAFVLGAALTAVEATTALPYFAALALLTGTGAPAPADILALVAYNVVFVTPALALVALHRWQRLRFGRVVAWFRRTALPASARLTPTFLAAGAFVLGTDAALGLARGYGVL